MNKIKMWIMYHEKDVDKNRWFIDTFIKTADIYNVDMSLVTVEQYEKNEVNMDDVIGVVARMINPEISYELEKLNIRVFNSAKVSYICNNKAETIRHLNSYGVKCIPTIIASENDIGNVEFDVNYSDNNKELKSLIEYISTHFKLPQSDDYVIKSISGHGGMEVMTLADYVDIYGDDVLGSNIFGKQEKRATIIYRDKYIIQPAVKNDGDVRVYVINGEIIGAVKRTSETLKSNFSLGGNVCLYYLTKEQKNIVNIITNNMQLDYAGIDFLLVDGEFVLNEIEDVVGARMLSSCSDIDYIELYVKYIKNTCNTLML